MNILDLASKSVTSIVKRSANKFNLKHSAAPEIPDAPCITMKNPASDRFNCGFASVTVMPEDLDKKSYWLAGYNIGNKIKGVLDPLTVNAMWLDCCDSNGMLLVSADLVGLTGYDIRDIRQSLSDFCEKSGCKHITISCTHTHAGVDTVGYWGMLPKSGKDKSYMLLVKGAIKFACIEAYKNRKLGKLYHGNIRVPEAVNDWREPIFPNDVFTRFRFVPDDGSRETWYLNFSAHPNTLGSQNSMISADYPGELRREINRIKETNVLFSVGAIGAADLGDFAEDKYERMVAGGRYLAHKAFEIENEVQLMPEIKLVCQPFYLPLSNTVLAFMDVLHVIDSLKYPSDKGLGIALLSEMTYMSIGGVEILTQPGEIFTELVYSGGYSTEQTSATGMGERFNPKTLAEICNNENLIIFGVTNDMTGYALPPNDFLLNMTQPYLSRTDDRFGRNHYHETNSLGPETAHTIADAFERMVRIFNKN